MLNVYRIAVFIQFKSKVSRVDYITIRSFYDNADGVRYGVSYIKNFIFSFPKFITLAEVTSSIFNVGMCRNSSCLFE